MRCISTTPHVASSRGESFATHMQQPAGPPATYHTSAYARWSLLNPMSKGQASDEVVRQDPSVLCGFHEAASAVCTG